MRATAARALRRSASSLRVKLTALIAGVAIFAAVSITAVRTVILTHEAESELGRRATVYVGLLADQLEPALLLGDRSAAAEVLASAAADSDLVAAALYAADGSLVEGWGDAPPDWSRGGGGVELR